MTRPLRALASLIVGITTVIGMIVYQHYSREPPTDAFTAALTVAATRRSGPRRFASLIFGFALKGVRSVHGLGHPGLLDQAGTSTRCRHG
jgi:hypothetical protein